jgi:uncharacterized protein YPO0396
MIELRRVILVDWYLFRAEQIDLTGMTALIGPNGAGKSAIIDAAQTVLTGANMHSIRFNASAQSASRSKRSIRDYCLGVVSLDEKGEHSEPTREEGYTYIVLGFVDLESGRATNLGVAFSASASRSEEKCEARFTVRGGLIDLDDLLEPLDVGEVETRQWYAVRQLLRSRDLEVEDDYGSATDFVAESLRMLSPASFPLDPRRFIKAFRNALLLKPVDNPTEFVRTYVLDVPTIRVDRLRRSIELYRDLTGKIENLKAQTTSLTQVQRIVARVLDNERAIHIAEWQVARIKWERFRREVRELQGELKRLRADAEAKSQQAVQAAARQSRIEVDLSHIELTLKTSDGEQLALMYEADRNLAIAEREKALTPLTIISRLVRAIESLTERRVVAGHDDILHGLLSAIVLAHKPAALTEWRLPVPETWQTHAAHLDQALAAVAADRLGSIQRLAADTHFRAQKEAHDIQERIDQIDANLKRLDGGLSPIERGTSALLQALEVAGIAAEPLCDIVDVRDQKWRVAAEAALSWSREALIVKPERAVDALEIYRRGSDEVYRHAEVVNTTKTAKTRPADKGSLATVISTDNPHARAFLDFRLGRLMMVDTMDRLLAADNAITADRMMQSGRTVKRLTHPGILKLGRATVEETRRLLTEDRAELLERLGEKARTALRLKEDSSLIDEVVRSLEEMRAQVITCVSIGGLLADHDRKIAELAANIDEARRSRDPQLVEKQARLQSELSGARSARLSAETAWKDAHGDEKKIEGTYEKLIRDHYGVLRRERRASAKPLTLYAASGSEAAKFEPVVRALVDSRLPEQLETFEADLRRRVRDRRQDLQRELGVALQKHIQQFSVSLPFSDKEATAEVVGAWAARERQRLEAHELVKYEEQCRNAAGEMTSAFRDDLLHRLHDAFEGIKETLVELNRHLKDREFHGRDYYVFRSSPDPAHADMLQLVQDSRRPDFQLPLFAARNADQADTPTMRAVHLIETILANPEAKTDEIEDPRKYFNFEVFIQDKAGKIRSSLSSRAGTGSGGEGQLPFYIAIGASLAATYRNRHTGATGLALAIFDEAFNRLDSKAICACSDFMRELGLQIVVATPDEKRHIFMEVADTIVNVNRSGNLVMVDTEHLSAKTRQALTEIDPYRKGFDAFKAELIANADAKDEQKEAAE